MCFYVFRIEWFFFAAADSHVEQNIFTACVTFQIMDLRWRMTLKFPTSDLSERRYYLMWLVSSVKIKERPVCMRLPSTILFFSLSLYEYTLWNKETQFEFIILTLSTAILSYCWKSGEMFLLLLLSSYSCPTVRSTIQRKKDRTNKQKLLEKKIILPSQIILMGYSSQMAL